MRKDYVVAVDLGGKSCALGAATLAISELNNIN